MSPEMIDVQWLVRVAKRIENRLKEKHLNTSRNAITRWDGRQFVLQHAQDKSIENRLLALLQYEIHVCLYS